MKHRLYSALALLLFLPLGGHAHAQSTPNKIEIHAKRFSFQPAEITITKGVPVTITLTSDDVPHSLLVKDLNINAAATKGHVTEVTITPDKAGDFKGRCGRFCGSGHGSMLFVVHVVEK